MNIFFTLCMLATTTTTTTTTTPNTMEECRCSNPYDGTIQSFIGNPSKNCDTKGVCFVPCNSPCPDTMPATIKFIGGKDKCQSNMACSLAGGFVPDRPAVIVKGLELNCKDGSTCEMNNIVTFVEKNTPNCQTSNC